MKNRKRKQQGHSLNEDNPDPREIERRAYQLYLAGGGYHGHYLEDWLKAERELKEVGQVAMSQ